MTSTQIISSPWFTLFCWISGILISVFLAFLFRQSKRPEYFSHSIRWYDGSDTPHKDIKLTFRGKCVPRFIITHVAFWNAGSETIREVDFVPAKPLGLEIPKDTEIFDIRITAMTASEIRARLDYSEAKELSKNVFLPIHFDYLDKNDGFSIQLIHDSKSGSDINLSGKIAGVSEIKPNALYSIERNGFSSLGRGPGSPFGGPIFKLKYLWAFIFSGFLACWSIYSATFDNFHWYQVAGVLFFVYVSILPFLLSSVSPPKALVDWSNMEKETE